LELVEPEGREAELDAFFAAIPVNLRHQGCEAYYEPTADRVTMPPTSLFNPASTTTMPRSPTSCRIMPQPGLCRMASWGLEFLRFGGVPLRHIPGTLEAIRWRTGTFQRN
jgi:hypothetical protein